MPFFDAPKRYVINASSNISCCICTGIPFLQICIEMSPQVGTRSLSDIQAAATPQKSQATPVFHLRPPNRVIMLSSFSFFPSWQIFCCPFTVRQNRSCSFYIANYHFYFTYCTMISTFMIPVFYLPKNL